MTDNRMTELCKLLDERGENYVHDEHTVTWSYYTDPHTATESMDGTLIVTGLTPEQAIVATLGGGECEFVGDAKYPPKCSSCGWQAGIYDCEWLDGGEFEYDGKFCKECGAKVKAVKQ